MNDQPWWRGVDSGHRLTGKRAFVTGAGTAPGGDLLGIGEAVAVLFASQGARVAVADVSSERAKATVGLINDAGAEGVAVVGDLSREADNARCVEEAVRALGGLDTVVNNVALSGGGGSPATVDLEVWERVMAVNVQAAMLTARHAIPHLKRAGGESIINVLSCRTRRPWQCRQGACPSPGSSPWPRRCSRSLRHRLPASAVAPAGPGERGGHIEVEGRIQVATASRSAVVRRRWRSAGRQRGRRGFGRIGVQPAGAARQVEASPYLGRADGGRIEDHHVRVCPRGGRRGRGPRTAAQAAAVSCAPPPRAAAAPPATRVVRHHARRHPGDGSHAQLRRHPWATLGPVLCLARHPGLLTCNSLPKIKINM